MINITVVQLQQKMLLQDPRQVDGAHKTITTKSALTRPETGRRSTQNNYKQMLLQDPRQVDGAHKTITNKCSYKTRDRSTEHTKQLQQKVLLQDPRQVDGAHKTITTKSALTRPETGRRSTHNYKQMLLQDPRQVDGAQNNYNKKCSYKTRDRSTEHTKQLQTNALTRPETGRRSTKQLQQKMLLQDPR